MFYNGWAILIAFLLATSGIRMAERAHRTGKARGLLVMMVITLVCGLYMFAVGIVLALNPQSVTNLPATEEFKAAIIRFLNVMWPLALMLMGVIAMFIGGWFLYLPRKGRASAAAAKKID